MSEAQEPAEQAAPGPRPHRCNARVEDLLQVYAALHAAAWTCHTQIVAYTAATAAATGQAMQFVDMPL